MAAGRGGRRTVARRLGAVLLAGVIAGCTPGAPSRHPAGTTAAVSTQTGSGAVADRSVSEIVASARAALSSAGDVRIVGQNDGADPFKIDMNYATNGSNGTFTTGGFDLQLRQVGDVVYLRGPDQFWKQQLTASPVALPKIAGKWVSGPADNAFVRQAAQITDIKLFATNLFAGTSDTKKGATTAIDGVPAIALDDPTGTLFVSAADARPLRLVGTGTASGRRIDFSYGAVAPVGPPPAADTVDARTLK